MEFKKLYKTITLRDLIPRLRNVKRRGEETAAACPVCEAGDSNGHHLYVRESDGKLLAYCQKCNAKLPEILKALGIRPEFVKEENPDAEEKTQNTETKPEPVKHAKPQITEEYDHAYKNPDGTVAYYKHRVKYADGSKEFRFRYVDEYGKTIFKKPAGCNNLYNLDLLERADADDCLYIVEGEKCADAMVRHGFLATTSNTGAQKKVKLSQTDLRYLKKFSNIVLIPDRDDRGAEYAKAWPAPVEVLQLAEVWPGCPPKGDVADYFARGGDPEKLSVFVDYSCVTRKELIGMRFFESLYAIKNENRRRYALSMAEQRAQELNISRQFSKGWQTFLRSKAKTGAVVVNRTDFPAQPLALNAGDWMADADGVKRMVQDRNGNLKAEYASRLPVLPLEILQNPDEGTEKIRIGYYKYGRWNSVLVPRSTAASNVKIVELADMGLDVTSESARLLVKYLADVTALNMDAIPVIKSCRHMGWAGDAFLPYTEDIKLDSEMQYKDLAASVSSKGDLHAWIKYTGELRKNKVLRLLMGASFASPLIARVNALPFVFHLWGATGTGKTALIMTADTLAGLTFYPREAVLTAEDVKPFLKVQTAIDAAERAYREIVGVIMEHEVNFKPDVNTARWGRMASTYVEINRSVLVRELQNIGFNFDAVKKQWAKQGYLLKNAYGKYASRASIDGENAYYVCLKFDPVA